MAAVGRHHRKGAAALRPRHLFCGLLCSGCEQSVVELVVDLDVDLVDVDLAVSICNGPRSVLFSFGLVAPTCFGFVFELFQTLKLSVDALDRLYRPACRGFVEIGSNNSF